MVDVLIPQSEVTVNNYGYPVYGLMLSLILKTWIIWLSNLSTLRVPVEGYSSTKVDVYVFNQEYILTMFFVITIAKTRMFDY
jgi:hypothetical protein